MHITQISVTSPVNSCFFVSGFFNLSQHFSFLGSKLVSLVFQAVLKSFEFPGYLYCSKSGYLYFKNCVIKQTKLTTNKLPVYFLTWILKKENLYDCWALLMSAEIGLQSLKHLVIHFVAKIREKNLIFPHC
jgi:hypothetical protein